MGSSNMEELGRIGRAKIEKIEKLGEFVLVKLEPEIAMVPILPGSDTANQIVSGVKQSFENNKRKNQRVWNSTADRVDNI